VTPSFARETVRAALRASGFGDAERNLANMASRARTAGLLPELWLRAARTTDDSLRLSPTADDPYNYTQVGGAGWWLEARLVFHLDRLLFDRDEVPIERLRRERSDSAAKLVNKVLATLFDWQRAAAKKDDPAASPEDREHAAFSTMEAEVTLDVLTAGWFSERLAKNATGAASTTDAPSTAAR
jgi:hypothetical protein